jgi:rhodanese-related sulfurtransferase
MSKRIDYGQIATKLDYPTLDKKLEQLAQHEPPKNRKTAVDLLEPLRERIIALHRKGWSSQQLAEELKAAGVPVNPARVRECLNRWTAGGKGAAKRRGAKRDKSIAAHPTPPAAANQSGRGKNVAGDGQPKLGLTQG